MASGLYGIQHTNRKDKDHWGKNCFNSSFPTSTACYMLANNIPAIYIRLENIGGQLKVVSDQIDLKDVFNCEGRSTDNLYFSFESVYEPYQQYSFDTIDGIDLVVKDTEGQYLSPLEIKLTVLPDSTTFRKSEDQWGSEMVIRSATTSYCALGMFDAVKDEARHIREIFEGCCSSIQMWDNDYEMTHKTLSLRDGIDNFERQYFKNQRPLVLQTIWKTQGKSPFLADNAFDIIVWSDYAFSRLFIDDIAPDNEKMSRPMRATARLARCLWELSKSGKIRVADIYRQMAFGNQTDKEFSKSGTLWKKYVSSPRITQPILPKEVVNEIIKEGYINNLCPERRLDQTLYFTFK